MLNAHFCRLDKWTGPRTATRQESLFRSKWVQTLDLLEYELDKLRAKDIVIQIEDPEGIKGIRNDGSYRMLSSAYTPKLAAVILTFESATKGNISMPCDLNQDWKDNLHAIALSLKALRAVDRYGVTRGNEQYRGWAQIEPPKTGMTKEQARQFLTEITDRSSPISDSELEGALRSLKIAYHPDRAQQLDENQKRHRHEMFIRIGQAEAVLCGEGK